MQESRRDEICNWLQITGTEEPVDLRSVHISFDQSEVLPNTGAWLLKELSYTRWKDIWSNDNGIWLYGDACFGKSFLCTHAIRDLQKTYMDRPLVPVVWHYFNFSDESANKVKIYQTLARELFRKLPADDDDEISDQVYTIAKKERCSTESLQNFVRAITAEFDTTFIFLDGLDEAYTDGSRRIAMLDVLHFCQQLATKPDGNVKLWCSSQKREKIEEKLKQFPSIHLTADKNAEDMSMLFKEAQRPGALNDISEAYRRLALILLKTKVKGNMLWAKLMMKSIEKAHDDEDIKKLIENIDDGCAGDFGKYLSKRIQDIEGSDLKVVWYESSSFVWFCRDRLRRFSQILSCLVYAKRDLRSDELCEAIAIFKTGKGKNISDSRIFTGKIVDWCAPLVRKSEHLQTTTYTVSHASVRQYLLSNPDVLQGKDLKEDLRISSEFMAFACLKYLQQPRYKHELKPKMGDQDIETFLTWDGQNTIVHHFLTYSAKYWAGHIEDFLKDRTDRQKVCDEVELFLKSNQFITCLQVQSLWVEGTFHYFYFKIDMDILTHQANFHSGMAQEYARKAGNWYEPFQGSSRTTKIAISTTMDRRHVSGSWKCTTARP